MNERERERERMGERDADSQRSICVEKGGARYGNRCHVRFISGLLSFFHLSSSIRLLTLPGLSLSLTHTHTLSLLIIISITFKNLHFETHFHMYTFSRLDNTVLQ